jgi:hypothetical protein
MNFIFGLSGGDMGLDTFDILNNPYIEYHGLERKGGRTFYPNYELEVCSKDHLALFLKDNQLNWYEQPICFKDRDKVRFQKSWMYEEYAFPVMIITYCRNTEENGNWCIDQTETDIWLARHISYFVTQDTRVQTDIWADTEEVVNEHPYYGDRSAYFPTMKLMKEVQFETIKVNPAYKQDEIMGDELWFGLSSIYINDDNIFSKMRETEVVNLISKVKFNQRRDAYNYDNTAIDKDDVIFIRNLMATNEGKIYSRVVTPIIDEIAGVGGLYYPVLFLGIGLSILFTEPLRKLDLALAFSKIKRNIVQ